jgi:ABC-2 type transport system permease protein
VNHFPTLLKREYWEHRGGLYWAPIWTAVALTVITLFGIVVAEIALRQHGFNDNERIHIGMDLHTFMKNVPDDKLDDLKRGFDIGLMGYAMPLRITLFFVMLFYCIGSLYDERKDRSVLFWKSLPVSDAHTVLSKLATVAVVAPLLTFAASVVLQTSFLLIMAALTLFHGGNPMRLVFGPAEPLALWARMLADVPVNSLWLLPAFGWLMFASSFARSKAFLWAVVPPIMLGVLAAMSDVLSTLRLPDSWIWVHVVARAFPIGLRFAQIERGNVNIGGMRMGNDGPELTWRDLGDTLMDPELWIGAVVGVGLIVASIHYRRKRELAD